MLTVDVFKDPGDYLGLVFAVIGSVATAVAVWVAVLDSKQANKRALAAEAQAAEARQETEELRRRQERERDDASAAVWADRQAIHISATARLTSDPEGLLFADVLVEIENKSDLPISNIAWFLTEPHSKSPGWGADPGSWVSGRCDNLAAVGQWHQVQNMIYAGNGPGARSPRVTVLFDDHFGNRWRLASDRSLFLSKRRTLGIDERPPLDESQLAFTG